MMLLSFLILRRKGQGAGKAAKEHANEIKMSKNRLLTVKKIIVFFCFISF